MEDQALRRLAAALAATTLLAGCGDDNKATTTEQPAAQAPSAKEQLAEAAGRLERAVPGRDCKALAPLMLHSAPRGADPDTPPTAQDCARLDTEARNELRGLKARRSVDFGAGGFTEGGGGSASTGQVVGVVWALDRDGSWKVVYDAIFRPQIGVPSAYGRAADRNAATFVHAVAAKDCDGMWRTLNLSSRFAGGGKAPFCRSVTPQYKKPDTAFAQIAADPGARLHPLGATRDIAFFGLELRNGRYMLIITSGRLGAGPGKDLRKQRQHVNPSVLEFVTVRRPGGD